MTTASTATTWRDIIYRALEDVGVTGVGQTPLAEDMNFGLSRLRAMVGQFNRRQWLVFHTQDVTCISTGSATYTLGVGQQFNVAIVDKLEEGCFVRQYLGGGGSSSGGSDFNSDFGPDFGPQSQFVSNTGSSSSGSDFNSDFNPDFGPNGSGQGGVAGPQTIDYALEIIESRSTWNRIAMKNLPSWPSFVFYDYANIQLPAIGSTGNLLKQTFPVGIVHINPVPFSGQFEIHLNVKAPLDSPINLSDVLLTPPEYEEAFEYNLALRFAAKYQIEASTEVIVLARAAMATLRSANNRTPLLQLPSSLTASGARYNIYSDRSQ